MKFSPAWLFEILRGKNLPNVYIITLLCYCRIFLHELYFSMHKDTFSYCFEKINNSQSIFTKSLNPWSGVCFLQWQACGSAVFRVWHFGGLGYAVHEIAKRDLNE